MTNEKTQPEKPRKKQATYRALDALLGTSEETGWDMDSQLTLALRFIDEQNLAEEFQEFLIARMKEEEDA